MSLHVFYNPTEVNSLPKEESWHGIKVMRLKAGDKAYVVDGKGNKHLIEITNPHLKKCEYKIISSEFFNKKTTHAHLVLSPTKSMEKVEWFVEKSIEIGIDEISFILCKNSERKILKLERLQKIAVSAMKQSKQTYITKINALIPFKEFIINNKDEGKFIAHLNKKEINIKEIKKKNSNCILIGPEGDFTKEEVEIAFENKYQPISLGENVLRTETAGVICSYELLR